MIGVWCRSDLDAGKGPPRGNVALSFKHRYYLEQRQLDSLTEYFAFADVRPVLQDLKPCCRRCAMVKGR